MNDNNDTSFSTHKQHDKVTRLSPLRRFFLRPRGVALLVIVAALGLNVSGAFGLNMLGLHSAVTSTSLPASFQSASTTTYGLLTPTATTCSQFASGNASTLSEIDYQVKTGKINSVAPGVFFYWVPITSSGTSDVFTIKESVTNPPTVPPKNTAPAFFTMASGSNVFTSPSCTAVKGATLQASTVNGAYTVTVTGLTAGSYIIGIKYTTSSVSGDTPPPPPPGGTAQYTFNTYRNGTFVPSSGPEQLSLVRK